MPNHFGDEVNLADYLSAEELALCQGRAIVVRKLKALPVEAVVRGYLIGSGWKDYQASGSVCGDSPAGRPASGAAASGADFHPRQQGRCRRA